MAKKTKTRTTYTRSAGSWLSVFSYIAVMLLGLGITISVVFGWINNATINGVAAWIKHIAIAIALIVPLFYSYYEARRHGTTWFILWIVAVILVVVFYVLGIALPKLG